MTSGMLQTYAWWTFFKKETVIPMMEWNDSYLIGIASLDYEHQDLFARINELHDDLEQQQDQSRIEECLGEILTRMAAHFALEETMMREKKYPYFAEHKTEHERLLDNYAEAIKNYRERPNPENIGVIENELNRWIINHVLGTDKKMSEMTGR